MAAEYLEETVNNEVALKSTYQTNPEIQRAQVIGQDFCAHYYKLFDTDRKMLESMYHKTASVMTFEGDCKIGSADIAAKLASLPLGTVTHVATTIDCQPTVDNSIVVTVLGQLKTDSDRPQAFHQTFMLKQVDGSFFILNDIFRLSLHNF